MPDTSGPKASRPNMPGYGIVDENSGSGLLAWSWAAERLTNSHNYWLATTRHNRRPHCMPVWGLWIDQSFCFSTGGSSVKARNLSANPYCVVSTEHADQAVIVEGVAAQTSDREFLARADKLYRKKYDYELDPKLGPIFIVKPRLAFGFIELQMTTTATRWKFA